MMNTTVNDSVQQIIQLLPPEYAKTATTAFVIAMGAISLYFTLIKPIMSAVSGTKALLQAKQENADLKNALNMSQEEMEQMVNGTFSEADKLIIKAKITELKTKLPFVDDENKALLQAQIDELQSALDNA